ncbi:4-hydroxy-3-polyprenylbenzoate decarboxylase [Paenibacillus sp. 1_12]|uniref:UbiX family flavin prenyltransferase n=1 Tax=Paenibacillus sp. 1_12 TaxID=1566278 RepID=UPI0008F06233|nr:flavin prenyltransferase UbiX [Paenibacillus sp. 1_12]SFK91814.1 4-hydroxy-3-polyprenylbenzoate decarboxylase [Paenibacillus sp. 1_12]
MSRPWVIGITGASGAAYGARLCTYLLSIGMELHVLITDAGWRVLKEELGWESSNRKATLQNQFGSQPGSFHYHPIQDIGASTASGSFRTAGMVVVPCSMGTLSSVASGASDNLLERTADVMLKEGRPLIMVPRETPLHAIHLENMLKLSRMGVRMIPAMPAFYQGPQTIEDMIDFVVGKILDAMQVEHELFKRWGSQGDKSVTQVTE